jgi:hypothetical protein
MRRFMELAVRTVGNAFRGVPGCGDDLSNLRAFALGKFGFGPHIFVFCGSEFR